MMKSWVAICALVLLLCLVLPSESTNTQTGLRRRLATRQHQRQQAKAVAQAKSAFYNMVKALDSFVLDVEPPTSEDKTRSIRVYPYGAKDPLLQGGFEANKANNYKDVEEETAVHAKKRSKFETDIRHYVPNKLKVEVKPGPLGGVSPFDGKTTGDGLRRNPNFINTPVQLFRLEADATHGTACFLPYQPSQGTFMEIPSWCDIVFTAPVTGCHVYLGRTGTATDAPATQKWFLFHVNLNSMRWPMSSPNVKDPKAIAAYEHYGGKYKDRLAKEMMKLPEVKMTQKVMRLGWEDYKYDRSTLDVLAFTVPVCVRRTTPGKLGFSCKAIQTSMHKNDAHPHLKLIPFKIWPDKSANV